MKIFKKPQLLLGLIIILGFLGFLDSTFLTIKHYQGTLPPCSLALGCEKVLNSSFATVGNIPIALLGSGFYLAVMGLSIIEFQKGIKSIRGTLFMLVLSGFIVSLILFLIQAFVLNSYCQYCIASEIISTILLISSIILIRSKENY